MRGGGRGRAAAAVGLALGLVHAAGAARAKPLREVAKIAVGDGNGNGIIGDAFALDERGARIAYLVTDGKGTTRLRVGPSAGAAAGKAIDLTRFSTAPERVVAVGSGWFVIANEGKRRAAAISPAGALGGEIGPFTDAFVSTARGPALVTVTDRGEKADGHAYDIAAFRAGGSALGRKALTIAADGTIAGSQGLTFQAFTNGYLQALVKKPGRYDAHADARGTIQIATYDLLTGAVSGAHALGNLQRYSDLVVKRNEKPGLEVFVRLADDGKSFELIGPGEKLRPLAFPGEASAYDLGTLDQRGNGARLYMSLVLEPVGGEDGAGAPRPARALHVFEVSPAAARATEIGAIPLGDDRGAFAWVAGGDKVAFMRKTMGEGGREIIIYQR
jgi:hypothetical protein